MSDRTVRFRQEAAACWNTAVSQNIVLVQTVGLCPVIIAGITLKNGVALTVCTLLAVVASSMPVALAGDRLAGWLRPLVNVLAAILVLFPAAFVLDTFISHELYASVDVFLPLIAVSALVIYHPGNLPEKGRLSAVLLDSFSSALGFGIVICTVSALREFVSAGTLWGVTLLDRPIFKEGSMPFVGFILLAFTAAFLQCGNAIRKRLAEPAPVQPPLMEEDS